MRPQVCAAPANIWNPNNNHCLINTPDGNLDAFVEGPGGWAYNAGLAETFAVNKLRAEERDDEIV